MTATADFSGRGLALPLGVEPNGSMATTHGVANLEKAMRVVLVTYLGERPMRPDFGSRLRDFVFDGVTSENAVAIANEVARALYECEPRVEVDAVDVVPRPEEYGRFDIEIRYTVKDTNEPQNLVVPFYTIPGEPGARGDVGDAGAFGEPGPPGGRVA